MLLIYPEKVIVMGPQGMQQKLGPPKWRSGIWSPVGRHKFRMVREDMEEDCMETGLEGARGGAGGQRRGHLQARSRKWDEWRS